MMPRIFRALRTYNYRIWAGGAFISNIGTWMQRTAQDWLVFVELTDGDASSLGIVMSLQFVPQLLLLPWTGFAADYFDRRKLVMTTQAMMGILSIALGALTVTNQVHLWHVYLFAFVFGCVTAFDSPARQIFVSDLVEDKDLSNAVALNSTSFNLGRMIGPAIAGITIAVVGSGWSFLLNGISFLAVLSSLTLLKVEQFQPRPTVVRERGSLVQGFRYVWKRPELKAIFLMLFLIGTFGMNFPIFISTMAVIEFRVGAGEFGLLTTVMAIGTVTGALLAAGRERVHLGIVGAGALMFGIGCALAALMPNYTLFGVALVWMGVSSLTILNASNSLLQLSTTPSMRGRVMAIRFAILLGGTPIGAPLLGWVADHLGPRWGLAIGSASGFAALMVAVHYMVKYRRLRMSFKNGRLHFNFDSLDSF